MYIITITVPGERANEVLKALDGAPVHLLEVHEGLATRVVLGTNDVQAVDTLKTWLDAADAGDGTVSLKAGDYHIDMGRFCRHCQKEIRGSTRDVLLPCPKPVEGRWCPLAFVMEHAAKDEAMTPVGPAN